MLNKKIIDKLKNNWITWFIIMIVVLLFGSIVWDYYLEDVKGVCLCGNESNKPDQSSSETLGCFEIKDVEQHRHDTINCDNVCASFDLDVGCWAVYS